MSTYFTSDSGQAEPWPSGQKRRSDDAQSDAERPDSEREIAKPQTERTADRRKRRALSPQESVGLGVRVRYFETDQMGIVHHANYAVWFEAARSEYCRQHHIDYRGMEADGLALPVVELSVRYLSAAHYEDELTIRTRVVECRRSLLKIVYSVDRDGQLLATGETLQILIERATGRPRAFPHAIAAKFLG